MVFALWEAAYVACGGANVEPRVIPDDAQQRWQLLETASRSRSLDHIGKRRSVFDFKKVRTLHRLFVFGILLFFALTMSAALWTTAGSRYTCFSDAFRDEIMRSEGHASGSFQKILDTVIGIYGRPQDINRGLEGQLELNYREGPRTMIVTLAPHADDQTSLYCSIDKIAAWPVRRTRAGAPQSR